MRIDGPEVLERLRASPRLAGVLAAVDGVAGVHVVGGAVRDVLLGREPAEVDLVVEGDATAAARVAATRLGGEVVVHERFGTATVTGAGPALDLAAARRETYPRPGALPVVTPGATLAEDLARRDFTVNAIAVALADGAVRAVPGAREDLEAGRLRVLHDGSFGDDPTRLLRMARYAARLTFEPAGETAALAGAAVAGGAVATVSGTRLGAELRLLLGEPQPAALVGLARFGVGRAVLGPAFAVDPGVVVRARALCPADAGTAALAAVLPGDAAVGDAPAEAAAALAARLDRLGFHAHERDAVTAAASRAPELAAFLAAGIATPPSALWRRLRRERPETVAVAGALAGPRGEDAARRWLGELRHVRPAITGDDLVAAGLGGPAVGRGLEAATAALLDGRAPDREAQLRVAMRA